MAHLTTSFSSLWVPLNVDFILTIILLSEDKYLKSQNNNVVFEILMAGTY